MSSAVIALVLAVMGAFAVIGVILLTQRAGSGQPPIGAGLQRLWQEYRGAWQDRSAFSSVRAEAASIAEPIDHTGDLHLGDLWQLSEDDSELHV